MPEPTSPEELLRRLQRSDFRRRFRLGPRERAYLERVGLPTVLRHGADFLRQRLAPALPANDGKQTPYRNHPVFVAQHATATCCRGCVEKWHGIPRGRELDEAEQRRLLAVIEAWLRREAGAPPHSAGGEGSVE